MIKEAIHGDYHLENLRPRKMHISFIAKCGPNAAGQMHHLCTYSAKDERRYMEAFKSVLPGVKLVRVALSAGSTLKYCPQESTVPLALETICLH